jgi:hypothetical protein
VAASSQRHHEELPAVEDEPEAAARLPAGEELGARVQAPGAILGVYTVDELEDSGVPVQRVQSMGVTSAAPAPIDAPAQAPAAAPALPSYSQAAFEKNLPSWNALIRSGKKSADQIVGSLLTKAALSEQQLEGIYALASRAADSETDELAEHADASNRAQPLSTDDAPSDPPF